MAQKTTKQLIAEFEAANRAAEASIAETNRILGISTASAAPVPVSTSVNFVPAKTYEEAKARLSEIVDPKTRNLLQGLINQTDKSATVVTQKAEALGYSVNPNTGALTPKAPTATTDGTVLSTNTNTTAKIDSIAAIKALLSSYGLGDLSASITEAVQKGYSGDTIQLIMQDPNSADPLAVAFQKRFSANKARAAAGKPVLSASEYLQAERTYTQVMQSYGVANLAKKETLSSFIEKDISAAEVADRVGLAIGRVQNADVNTKKALAEFYPMLNQTDIVGAMLDPTEGLPALQRKVQLAEIGGAAIAQNIKTGLEATTTTLGVKALADLGITKEQARAGFEQVAEVTPRGTFLSEISASGQEYKQIQAEQEAFQGLASAKRARQTLTEEERARFGGASGMSKASLNTQSRGLI